MNELVNSVINDQIQVEYAASQKYLKMATLLESYGYGGSSEFFYRQSEEEREHMMKLIRFLMERGGDYKPPTKSPSELIEDLELDDVDKTNVLKHVFEMSLKGEQLVTEHVNRVVHICREVKDYTTENFMQWFVTEQIEEEKTFNDILDKINLIGDDRGGQYLIDTLLLEFNLNQMSN